MPIPDIAKNLLKKVGDVLCCRWRSEDAAAEEPHIPPATNTPNSTTTPRVEDLLPSTSANAPAAVSDTETQKFLETFQKTYSNVQKTYEATVSLPSRTKNHIKPMHLYMGAFFDACYHSTLLPDGLACDDPAMDRIVDHYFRETIKKVKPPILSAPESSRFSFRPFPAPSVTYKILRDDFQGTPIEYLPLEQRWRFAIEPDAVENMQHFGILKTKNFLKPLLYDTENGYFHRMILTWKDVFSKKKWGKINI